MPKLSDVQYQDVKAKLDELHEEVAHLRTLDARFDDIIEHKLFEVRTLLYIVLLITGVSLALAIGALARQLAG